MRYLSLFAASLLPALVLADRVMAQAAETSARRGTPPAAVAPPAQPSIPGGGFSTGGVGGGGSGVVSAGGGVVAGGYGGSVGATRIAPAAYQVEVMRSWMDTVDRFVRLSQDPVASGVAGVITAVDLLRPQGPEATLDYLNKLMSETQNATVRRAIRLEMIEMYKATGQRDKALDVLHELIVTVPGEGESQPSTLDPMHSIRSRVPRASSRQLRIPPPPVPEEAGR